MSCETVRKQLPLYAGGDVSDRAAKQVALHLLECDACRAELAAYQAARAALSSLSQQSMTAPSLKALQRNIRWRVRSLAAGRSAPGAGHPAARLLWRVGVTGGLAAALALVLGARFLHTSPENETQPPVSAAGLEPTVPEVADPGASQGTGLPARPENLAAAGAVPSAPEASEPSGEATVETVYSTEKVRNPLSLYSLVDFTELPAAVERREPDRETLLGEWGANPIPVRMVKF